MAVDLVNPNVLPRKAVVKGRGEKSLIEECISMTQLSSSTKLMLYCLLPKDQVVGKWPRGAGARRGRLGTVYRREADRRTC